jgi:hypothetical protein
VASPTFLNPLGFATLMEVNEFVTKLVNKRIGFEKKPKAYLAKVK